MRTVILAPMLLLAGAAAAQGAEASSPVYDIPRLKGIVVDGNDADWGDRGFRVDVLVPLKEKLKRTRDHDASFRLGWNDHGLLVLVSVRDNRWVEHEDDGWLWRYDGVEVFLTDAPGSGDICQWVISPGMTREQKALRWKLHDHRKDEKLKQLPARLNAARRGTRAGYVLEVSVPWSCLAIEPEMGREVGFQIYVNDADKVDGDTYHAVWYPAKNTAFDTSGVHRIRLAGRPSQAVQLAGNWRHEWPLTSRAVLWTTASVVGEELAVREPGGGVLARGTVKRAGRRGRVELDLPVGLSDPNIAFLELAAGDVVRGALQVPEDVRDNSRSRWDIDALREALLSGTFRKQSAEPDLLFPAKQAGMIVSRAAAQKEQLDALEARCRELVATEPDVVTRDFARHRAREAQTVATGYFFLKDPEFAAWAKLRVKAVLGLETWMFSLHSPGCKFTDHVTANVGASIAQTHDLLGDQYSKRETKRIVKGMKRLLFEPYMKSARGRNEWWASKGLESNWKIMTHGEAGLAICEFVDYWPEAREALAHAALGVVEILDMVPEQGDWPEGPNYWMSTLHMGLRYATALRILTDGAVDLYEHPALKTTGDFAIMLTTPGRHVFNYSDNRDRYAPSHRECLAMLAYEAGRGDWMHVARLLPALTPLYLAYAGSDLPSTKPDKLTALFRHSGVATLRTGWGDDDTFVGVKSSATFVGHGHLDAASFVIESGGQWLVTDNGYWPYAAQIGFHDYARYRWNWDNMGTVGHNTLLIDGKGQSFGEDYSGSIRSLESGEGWDMIVADASKCYPGMLNKFVRTVLFLKPDVIVVRDVVECEGERHAEWLLHHAGEIRSEGLVSIVENNGVSLTIVPFLPGRKFGWRVSDVRRTSTYEKQGVWKDTTQTVRYRSFSPFRKSEKFEFLFGLRVGGEPDGKDWTFETTDDGWSLKAKGHEAVVRPRGDALSVE